MAKYLTTILFTLTLGFAGGYSVAIQRARDDMRRAVKTQEGTMAQGVLLNDSAVFTFLAEHLHAKGVLKDDPQSVKLLQIALEGIIRLDDAYRQMRDEGRPVPLMFEDSRKRVEDALKVLRSYPALGSEEDNGSSP